jgi:hypothetical protein
MKIQRLNKRISNEEKETLLIYDYVDKKWTMDSTVSTHYNKALKQGWTPIERFEYEDGTIFGYKLEAPKHAVTIRSVEKKTLSQKQMENLLDS